MSQVPSLAIPLRDETMKIFELLYNRCAGCGRLYTECECEKAVNISGPTAGEECPKCDGNVKWVDKGDWRKFMTCNKYPGCSWKQPSRRDREATKLLGATV